MIQGKKQYKIGKSIIEESRYFMRIHIVMGAGGTGKTEVLTSKEAFDAGWDYPGIDGIYKCENFKVLAPRTCGKCGMAETAWWSLTVNGKKLEELSKMQKLTVERIMQEPDNLMI